jgi:hypothetical protein
MHVHARCVRTRGPPYYPSRVKGLSLQKADHLHVVASVSSHPQGGEARSLSGTYGFRSTCCREENAAHLFCIFCSRWIASHPGRALLSLRHSGVQDTATFTNTTVSERVRDRTNSASFTISLTMPSLTFLFHGWSIQSDVWCMSCDLLCQTGRMTSVCCKLPRPHSFRVNSLNKLATCIASPTDLRHMAAGQKQEDR